MHSSMLQELALKCERSGNVTFSTVILGVGLCASGYSSEWAQK